MSNINDQKNSIISKINRGHSPDPKNNISSNNSPSSPSTNRQTIQASERKGCGCGRKRKG